MPTVAEATHDFLAQRRIAVAGVSRQKGGAHGGNVVYPIFDAVKTYATLGEICDTLRGVYGEYTEAG